MIDSLPDLVVNLVINDINDSYKGDVTSVAACAASLSIVSKGVRKSYGNSLYEFIDPGCTGVEFEEYREKQLKDKEALKRQGKNRVCPVAKVVLQDSIDPDNACPVRPEVRACFVHCRNGGGSMMFSDIAAVLGITQYKLYDYTRQVGAWTISPKSVRRGARRYLIATVIKQILPAFNTKHVTSMEQYSKMVESVFSMNNSLRIAYKRCCYIIREQQKHFSFEGNNDLLELTASYSMYESFINGKITRKELQMHIRQTATVSRQLVQLEGPYAKGTHGNHNSPQQSQQSHNPRPQVAVTHNHAVDGVDGQQEGEQQQ